MMLRNYYDSGVDLIFEILKLFYIFVINNLSTFHRLDFQFYQNHKQEKVTS